MSEEGTLHRHKCSQCRQLFYTADLSDAVEGNDGSPAREDEADQSRPGEESDDAVGTVLWRHHSWRCGYEPGDAGADGRLVVWKERCRVAIWQAAPGDVDQKSERLLTAVTTVLERRRGIAIP